MSHRWFVLLLFSTLAFGQAAPVPAPQKPAQAPATPATAAPKAEQAKPAEVPPTAPVITIEGLCNQKPGQPKSAACKTVITRAEFERMMNAVAPEAKEVPPVQRQRLADGLTQLMVAAHRAEQMGLQNKPEVQEMFRLQKMNVLARELLRSLQAKYAHSSPAEIQKYYNDHKDQFEEASFKRVYIPKAAPGENKPVDEAAFKARADKIRQEAVAGTDFNKLEQEAFEGAGIKQSPPPTTFGPVKLSDAPAAHKQAFDLKPGEVSPLIPDASGDYLYKLESKRTIPLDQAKDTIEKSLMSEKMEKAVAEINNAAHPILNPAYFGPQSGAAPGSASAAPTTKPKPAATPAAKPASPAKPPTSPK